jgi:hypothetical protein
LKNKSPARQSQFALDFLNRIISHADLSSDSTLELAKYLWRLSKLQQTNKFQVNFKDIFGMIMLVFL